MPRSVRFTASPLGTTLAVYFETFLRHGNQVPEIWQRSAYPSQLSLGAWLTDFAVRMSQMRLWMRDGPPPAFWLPAFFFPQARSLSIVSLYRQHMLQLRWDLSVMNSRKRGELAIVWHEQHATLGF